ncbi:MAG: MlrC C-terminal domain-containing protein, partial [Devosia sp.]
FEVVLASKRAQTFHPDVFTRMGIDLRARKAVAIKSASHFYPAFAPIAGEIIYVNCGGPYPPDPRAIAYTRLRRPMAPMEPSTPVWMTE